MPNQGWCSLALSWKNSDYNQDTGHNYPVGCFWRKSIFCIKYLSVFLLTRPLNSFSQNSIVLLTVTAPLPPLWILLGSPEPKTCRSPTCNLTSITRSKAGSNLFHPRSLRWVVQCDQIGLFLQVLGNILSHKSSPNEFMKYNVKNVWLLFGHFWGEIRQLFIQPSGHIDGGALRCQHVKQVVYRSIVSMQDFRWFVSVGFLLYL